MTLDAAQREYLAECKIRQYTNKTILNYRNHTSLFIRWCKENKLETLEEIKESTIKDYLRMMESKGISGNYQNGILKVLKSFINYLNDQEYIGWTISKKISWAKEKKTIIETFTHEHIQMMLDNCKGTDFFNVRNYAIISFLFDTGVRCWELCSIKWEDLKENYVVITNGKNHKERALPINPVLNKALTRWKAAEKTYFDLVSLCTPGDGLFVSRSGRQKSVSAVENILKEAGKDIQGVRVSPHTCRHTYAQYMLQSGVDLYSLSRLLGHENVNITQVYLRSLRDIDIVEEVQNMSLLEAATDRKGKGSGNKQGGKNAVSGTGDPANNGKKQYIPSTGGRDDGHRGNGGKR